MGLKISILNSRQGIKPCLSDQWIQNTIEAIKYIKKNDYTLITSVGMPTWEMITTLGSLNKIPMIVYLPLNNNNSITKTIDSVKTNFELQNQNIDYIPLLELKENTNVKLDRDTEIVTNSDFIIPISIREQGNLYNMIRNVQQNKIIDTYRCTYTKSAIRYSYTIDSKIINPNLTSLQNNYIYHWTKSTYGKRENESSIDYYKAILNSHKYPRTAFQNLLNIIREKTIFASSKDIPLRTKVVSFTDSPPELMYQLFRWRSRHSQMSFEPYGIAFKKESLHHTLYPVKYYTDLSEIDKSIPRWQTHSQGKKADWSLEREFRHLSDFNFDSIKLQNIFLITRFKKEADELNKLTGIKTISYTIE